MAINKISGNILADNLVRGSNLAIQSNLVYFDVTNNRVGVGTSVPADTLSVIGVANASNVRITSATANGIFYADTNKLALTTANLTWNGTVLSVVGNVAAGNVIASDAVIGNVDVGNITVSGNISVESLSANLFVIANGNITGSNLISNAGIFGSFANITGNINSGNINSGNVISNSLVSGANIQATSLTANRVVYVGANDYLVDNANLVFDGTSLSVTGNLIIDNITIDGTDIISNANITIQASANGNIALQPAGNGLVIIDTVTGLVLPQGNTIQRPAPAVSGTLRWNTASLQVEVYDGTSWEDVGSDLAAISDQTLNGDGSTINFALDQATLANNIIVSTNGVVQKPGVAYTVTGNLITFTEAPSISDVIDVRFIATLATINAITNSGGNSIAIDASGVANASLVQSLQLPAYTVAQATSLANVANGQIIYVSNGDSGSACLAVYSVNAWKRVSLGANIST